MILCSKSILILPLLYFRLAFHDCLPYENGGGDGKNGCDGCLDFDENEDDHNVLQPTVLPDNRHVNLYLTKIGVKYKN